MKVLKWTQQYQDQAAMCKKSFMTQTNANIDFDTCEKNWLAMGEMGVNSFQCSNDAHFPHLLCGVALSAPEQSPDRLYRNFDRGQLFN
jgi:hypothetical protein